MRDNSDMTDDDFINYCDTHWRNPRPLFAAAHVNRMIALAGNPEWAQKAQEGTFVILRQPMQRLVDAARLMRSSNITPPVGVCRCECGGVLERIAKGQYKCAVCTIQ
jgi:hypothetical protein